jgi:hypothetical protein
VTSRFRVMTAENRLEIGQILEVSLHNHHTERDEYPFAGNVKKETILFS